MKNYWITIIPPDPVLSEIIKLKHNLADQFGSYAGVYNIPHITILESKMYENKVHDFKGALGLYCSGISPFRITLENPSFFVETNNLYLHAGPVDILTEIFQKAKMSSNNYKKIFPFFPHLTIAYQLPKAKKAKIIDTACLEKDLNWSFLCEKIYLYKRSRFGKELIAEIELKGEILELPSIGAARSLGEIDTSMIAQLK